MVQVPRGSSQGQLTTRATSPLVDPSTFGAEGRAFQNAGKALLTLSDHFRELQTLTEVSNATIALNQQLNQLEQETLDDPNLTEASALAFSEQANESINNISGSISDQRERIRFNVVAQGSRIAKGLNVKREGRSAHQSREFVKTETIASQSIENTYKAGNAVDAAVIRSGFLEHLRLNVDKKLLSPKQAQAFSVNFDETVRKGKPQFDLDSLVTQFGSGGAEIFMERVSDNKNPAYPNLTQKETQAFFNQAKNVMEREKVAEKLKLDSEQAQTQTDILDKVLDFGYTNTQLRAMGLSQEISDGFLSDAIAYNDSIKPGSIATNMSTYNEIFDMIEGVEKKEDGNDFTRKEITETLLEASLVDLGITEYKELKKRLETELDNESKLIISNEVKGIRAWARQRVAPSASIETLTESEKAKVDQVEFFFRRRIIEEDAKGARIQQIAEEVRTNSQNILRTGDIDTILNATKETVIDTLFEGRYRRTGPNQWTRIKD